MNKSYVLWVWILGLSLLSSVAVTYATDETLEEQDSSVVFSHHFDKKEKKPEGKRDLKMDMKAPKDFKELTEEEKAEFEAKKLEMQEKMKTEFQEKLSKGEITQEEYDTFIENLENGKIGCPMEWKRKMGAFKGENNEENKEAWQFKMMKKIGKKVHAFKKTTSEQE